MNADVIVKICGLNTAETIDASVKAGAKMLGFVFCGASPRSISPELAVDLIRILPTDVKAVGVFVDPDDAWLEQVLSQVPIDMIQLNGTETPDRVADVKAYYPLPVIKAIQIETAEDLKEVLKYRHRADYIMLDAKMPRNVTSLLPSGNGIAFDWDMLSKIDVPAPWILSGGLTSMNAGDALRITGAKIIDVSTGVEDVIGQKSIEKIADFMHSVREEY